MDVKEYQAQAMRTAKMFGLPNMNLMHAALGIGSEIGELLQLVGNAWMKMPFNAKELPKEIGDVCWYCALLCDLRGWRFEDMFLDPNYMSEVHPPLAASVLGRNPPAMCLVSAGLAGDVLTLIKAHTIYGKPLDDTLLKRKLGLLVSLLSLIADIHGCDFNTVVLAGNIAKLRERYPEKYTDEAAIARADMAGHDDMPGNESANS